MGGRARHVRAASVSSGRAVVVRAACIGELGRCAGPTMKPIIEHEIETLTTRPSLFKSRRCVETIVETPGGIAPTTRLVAA